MAADVTVCCLFAREFSHSSGERGSNSVTAQMWQEAQKRRTTDPKSVVSAVSCIGVFSNLHRSPGVHGPVGPRIVPHSGWRCTAPHLEETHRQAS